MNLLDFQRLGIENGELDESDIDAYAGKNVLLNFVKTELGYKSKFNNLSVFPKTEYCSTMEGTWICTLEKANGMYRAIPVRKIDASFFMELKRSQKDEIVSALWNDHKEELMPELKEKYLEIVQEDVEKAVEEATESMNKTIEELREEKAELEKTIEANRIIMENMNKIPEASKEPPEQQKDVILSTSIVVKRVSPDMISSPFFTNHKYFVHVSHDLKTLVIQPHDYGTVICINNVLLLSGLGNISSFTEETELQSEYVSGKGLVVHL